MMNDLVPMMFCWQGISGLRERLDQAPIQVLRLRRGAAFAQDDIAG